MRTDLNIQSIKRLAIILFLAAPALIGIAAAAYSVDFAAEIEATEDESDWASENAAGLKPLLVTASNWLEHSDATVVRVHFYGKEARPRQHNQNAVSDPATGPPLS